MLVRRLSSNQDFEDRHTRDRQEQPPPLDRRWHPPQSQDHSLAQLRRRYRPQAKDTGMIPQWAPAFGWILFCIAAGTLLAIMLTGCAVPLR